MPIVIETKRCFVSEIFEDDFEALAALHADPEVRRFLGGALTRSEFEAQFASLVQQTTGLALGVRLSENDILVGLITLMPHHDQTDVEISYQFSPQVWGTGIAREAVGATLAFAFKELNLPRIVAETQSANAASCRLLERLGMTLERKLLRYEAEQSLYVITRQVAVKRTPDEFS